MTGKIVINPIDRGVRQDRTAFNIDNDSFPELINAYQWRGRLRRKRGTSLLGRLNRSLSSITLNGQASGSSVSYADLFANSAINLRTLEPDAAIIPGTLSVTVGAITFSDPGTGTLTGSPSGNTGNINYATGALNLSFSPALGAPTNVVVSFSYYPNLPVMGLEQFDISSSQFAETVGFDTIYAYDVSNNSPYPITDISFYKNPAAIAPYNYSSYVAKTTPTPLTWNGQNYQQFWTVNYQGALWATNGITVPFTIANVGMQYKPITTVTVTSATTATLAITAHGLVKGDFLFINEVTTTTGINFQTGYVTSNDPQNPNQVDVTFPNANLATNGTGGIAQYLTNRSDPTKDCIRWYDGNPDSSSRGWVNFCPPLSQSDFSIADQVADQYYLVGARVIFPFKDRLIFFGPVIQTSTANSQIYLQDTIIYSQNGTPFYTASFTGDIDLPTTVFHPILTPLSADGSQSTVQTATANAFFEDQSGFGGFLSAGISQPILTVSNNEDVLIVGFNNLQTRLVYTQNDIVPFNFFTINAELGSGSTFSAVNLDRGVISLGNHGITITSQVGAERIDLDIPDQIFQFNLNSNGFERVCAQRDFINEWIYFTYMDNEFASSFPNQTLQYNYRDKSWAFFNETYTTYGIFKPYSGYTWATIGNFFPTWAEWTIPWNAGSTTLFQPKVIAGNQQGFILIRDSGDGEGDSLFIQSISGTTITCPNHCLNNDDFIIISGCVGITGINDVIFKVSQVTEDTFVIIPQNAITISGTYLGGGVIKRMYNISIKTKQFPVSWSSARKTRIGVQQYLLSTTSNGQITLSIYLNECSDPYFSGPDNPSLVYSQILYTCPESTNLGLSPSNINLQMPTAVQQQQIWHRVNNSLIGDTIQLGFSMSDDQMYDPNFNNQFAEIAIHAIVIDVSPSSLLA